MYMTKRKTIPLNFDQSSIEHLAAQLHIVINFGDPDGFLRNNYNFEIDDDYSHLNMPNTLENDVFENAPYNMTITNIVEHNPTRANYPETEILVSFRQWWILSSKRRMVQQCICSQAKEIKKLFDKGVHFRDIIQLAFEPIQLLFGDKLIDVPTATIAVSFIGALLLKGSAKVCYIDSPIK